MCVWSARGWFGGSEVTLETCVDIGGWWRGTSKRLESCGETLKVLQRFSIFCTSFVS